MTLATSLFANKDSPSSRRVAGSRTSTSQLRKDFLESTNEHHKNQYSVVFTNGLRSGTTLVMDWQPESPVVIVTSAEEGAHGSSITNEANADSQMSDISTEIALSCNNVASGLEGMDWEPSSCTDQDSDTLSHCTDEDNISGCFMDEDDDMPEQP